MCLCHSQSGVVGGVTVVCAPEALCTRRRDVQGWGL